MIQVIVVVSGCQMDRLKCFINFTQKQSLEFTQKGEKQNSEQQNGGKKRLVYDGRITANFFLKHI